MRRLKFQSPVKDPSDIFFESGKRLLDHHDPLTRLAGRLALLPPHDAFPPLKERGARHITDTIWKPAAADAESFTLTRHMTMGRRVGDLTLAVTAIGRYGGKYNKLQLEYVPGRGARFLQDPELVDYLDPLPTLASEVALMDDMIGQVRSEQLVVATAA